MRHVPKRSKKLLPINIFLYPYLLERYPDMINPHVIAKFYRHL